MSSRQRTEAANERGSESFQFRGHYPGSKSSGTNPILGIVAGDGVAAHWTRHQADDLEARPKNNRPERYPKSRGNGTSLQGK